MRRLWWVITLLIASVPGPANGDGGVIRLRESEGAFAVTVFSPPEATTEGATDVSMLIQETGTAQVVLDAAVSVTPSSPQGIALKPPPAVCCRPRDGASNSASVRATRGQASNKLLYAAPLELNAPGNWQLDILVSRGTDVARFNVLLPVTANSGRLTRLWPFLSFPPLAAAGFALNQWLRFRSLRKLSSAQPTAGSS